MKIPAIFFLAWILAFMLTTASFAMDQKKIMAAMGNTTHEEVVEGVKATFKFLSMKECMKEMNIEVPKGMKETHHIMVEFKDAKTGKSLPEGEVTMKIQNPAKSAQTKVLMAMKGMAGMGAGFGADFDLSQKGKYGIMTKFKLKDGKIRSSKFWYEPK